MAKQQLIDALAEEIVGRKICAHLAQPGIKLVMGDGNLDAEIVFIGEAPGKEENRLGLPFVGASGKFLNEMLASIGLDRKAVYITNIVKYRPPDNRDPSPEEKAEFRPYLDRQIAIIQPKVIVTLGRHSLNEFLPAAKISQVHGLAQREHNPPIFPLFHPAAALYNGGMRAGLLEDFQKLGAFLKS